jgi:hypothetical protein
VYFYQNKPPADLATDLHAMPDLVGRLETPEIQLYSVFNNWTTGGLFRFPVPWLTRLPCLTSSFSTIVYAVSLALDAAQDDGRNIFSRRAHCSPASPAPQSRPFHPCHPLPRLRTPVANVDPAGRIALALPCDRSPPGCDAEGGPNALL